jgi:hypothetical protein
MFNGSEISTEDSIIEVELKLEVVFIDIHCDTLKYYNTETSIITNDSDASYDSLTDTDGGDGSCDNCGGSGQSSCDCGGDGDVSCYDCGGDGNL